jgi:hypothetical protein
MRMHEVFYSTLDHQISAVALAASPERINARRPETS